MNTFSIVIYTAIALSTLIRAILLTRQMHHVWQHRQHIPIAFVDRISAAQHALAAQYTLAKNRVALLQLGMEVLLLLVFTLLGGLNALNNFWHRLLTGEVQPDVALMASVLLLSSLVELPLDIYRKFNVEQRFGFNAMTVQDFVRDLLMQTLLASVLGLPLLYAVMWIMHHAGDSWWWVTWLVWVGFNVLVMALYPVFIAPLFNKFVPLTDEGLRQRIVTLLEKAGFAAQGVYVMDGSRRSRHGNAYFTGFGRSRRIVLFDTLLKQLQPQQIEAVLAHEIGHFHHHHVVKRMAGMFGLSLAVLWGIAQLIHSPWFFSALHINQPGAGIALVLFFLLLPVFTLPFQVLFSIVSRRDEFQADRYAAQHVGAAHLISALLQLYSDNASTLTPDPWYSLFYDSHPNAQQRIARLVTFNELNLTERAAL